MSKTTAYRGQDGKIITGVTYRPNGTPYYRGHIDGGTVFFPKDHFEKNFKPIDTNPKDYRAPDGSLLRGVTYDPEKRLYWETPSIAWAEDLFEEIFAPVEEASGPTCWPGYESWSKALAGAVHTLMGEVVLPAAKVVDDHAGASVPTEKDTLPFAETTPPQEEMFERELGALLDRYSQKDDVAFSDFVIADYLKGCLDTFKRTLNHLNS